MENKGQMKDMNGQATPFVLFKAEMSGMQVYITESGITYNLATIEEVKKEEFDKFQIIETEEIILSWSRIDMILEGADIRKENIISEQESITAYNFFSPHCPQGIYGVREYKKITIANIYPGIDWVLYTNEGSFKYDFVVHVNANPDIIKLNFSSKEPLYINDQGEIVLKTRQGIVTEKSPKSFYNGFEIASKFAVLECRKNDKGGSNVIIGFDFHTEDMNERLPDIRNTDLIIDPELNWATFYSGHYLDGPMSVCNDSMGNVFVTGYTKSSDFPVYNPGGGAYYDSTLTNVGLDGMILKFNNMGVRLWATYYNGVHDVWPNSILADRSGNVFVTGYTAAENFPTYSPGENNFFQENFGGGLTDAFILKFNNNGVRLWATYYGGNGDDIGNSMDIDKSGNIYITGSTSSNNFPLYASDTIFYLQAKNQFYDAVILKFNNLGERLWSTCLGGDNSEQGNSIKIDYNGNVFVTGKTLSDNFPLKSNGSGYYQTSGGGTNAFISKFNDKGIMKWSTYYGGTLGPYNFPSTGWCNSMTIDDCGNIFVAGVTDASDFPVYNPGGGAYFQNSFAGGPYDLFISKFSNDGDQLWSTYFGGGNNGGGELFESFDNMAINSKNEVYLTFNSSSSDIVTKEPTDIGYFDDSLNVIRDIIITRFSNNGILQWATYFGGNGDDFREAITVDRSDNLFVVGEWAGNMEYPLTDPGNGAFMDTAKGYHDGFIAKFTSSLTPTDAPYIYGDSIICLGDTVMLSASPSNLNYLWNTGSVSSVISTSPIKDSLFTVTVKSSSGCYGTSFKQISVNYPVVASIQEDTQACGGVPVTLTVFPDSAYYLWSTTDTTSFIVVDSSDTYSVILTMDSVCFSQDTILVFFNPCLSVPDIFSPNADGVNDIFIPLYLGELKQISFKVFNRWGELIFESDNEKTGWDGTFKKELQPVGVYFYELFGQSYTGEVLKKQGKVTLLR